mgnify:CR=1 FL=1
MQTFRESAFKAVPTVIFVEDDKKPVPLLWNKIKSLCVRMQKSKLKRLNKNLEVADESRSRHPMSRRGTHTTPRDRRSNSKAHVLPRNVTMSSACFESGATICSFLSWMHKNKRRPLQSENHPWAKFAHRMYAGNWESEDRLGDGPRQPLPDNQLAQGVGGGDPPADHGRVHDDGPGASRTVNLADLADSDLNTLRRQRRPMQVQLKQRSTTEQAVLMDGMMGVNPRTYGQGTHMRRKTTQRNPKSRQLSPSAGHKNFMREAVV